MRRTTDQPGFTLIEMAVVLIIVGIIIALALPIVSEKLRQEKLAKSRGSLNALKQEIIGFARVNSQLPSENTVEGTFANVRDAQQNYIAYYVDPALKTGDVCDPKTTTTTYALTIGGKIYSNLAFILASRGANQNLEINSAAGGSPPTSRTVASYAQGTTGVDVLNADPPNTTGGPYDVTPADANAQFDDLVEYVSLSGLQKAIGCVNPDQPTGAATTFQNMAQAFAKGARNFVATGSTNIVNITATTVDLGNEQTDAAGCIWSNATIPDANGDGIWDGMSTQTTGHGLTNEHFVCRTNGGPDGATGNNNAVYCYAVDAAGAKTSWTKIAAVFKLATLFPDASVNSQDYMGGFIFSLISADGDGDGTPCNGAPDNCGDEAPCSREGSPNRGPYLGWSDSTANQYTIHTPKIGVEVDFFPDSSRTDPDVSDAINYPAVCASNATMANHVAVVYYTNSGGGATDSLADDNQHGATIPMTGPITVNPEYADESGGVANCSQDNATGPNGFATNATAWDDKDRHKQWLEDGDEHWVRIQIERNTTSHVYNVYFWLDDTPDATFLNVDLVNGAQMDKSSLSGADYYEHSQVTLPAADDAKFDYFRFGWSFGFGTTGVAQTISLSRFGLNATR